MHPDISGPARASIWQRWGLNWQAIAILLGLLYFTPIGGTRAGTYHFPLVAFSHLLAIALLGLWAARRLSQGRWLPRTPLDLPLLVFYVLNVVSTALSADLRVSVENLAHLTIFILVYYIVVDVLLSGCKVSDLVMPMLIVAGVVVLAEILELALWLGIWVLGTGEISPLLTLGEYRRRLVMGPANVLAWYIVLLLPLVLAQSVTVRSFRAKLNLVVLAAGAVLVLASTLSRSGLIGMAGALATFALLTIATRVQRGRVSLRSHVRSPAVMGVLLLTALLSVALLAAALDLMSARLYTISVRLELWQAASRIVAGRPLFGGGPGTFGYLFHQVPDSDVYAQDTYYNTAHNGFINVAAESGLPSLVAGIWLIMVLVRTGWRSLRGATEERHYSPMVIAASVAGVVGLMASMLFDVPWVFPLTTLYVALFAAIVVAPFSSQRRVSTRPILWATALALVLLVAVLAWGDVAHYFQHRAVGAMNGGRFDASVTDLQKSVRVDPLLTMYRFQLGTATAYLGLENGDQAALHRAMEAYEQEIAQGGDTPINNGNLAWLESTVGNLDDAVSHMKRASAQAPRDGYYKLGLGYLLETAGNYQQAREAYAAAVAATPSLIDSAFWQTSQLRKAFKWDIQKQEPLPGLAGAWVAYLIHDYTEAARILEGLRQSGASLVLTGRVQAAQGQYAAAQESLDKAIAMSRTNSQAYLARGQLYLDSGEESKARHDLRVAGLRGEKRADLVLGEMAYRSGDLEKAIALYQGSAPDCVALTSSYDYASQVYHRSDVSADFWPESITCAPYDGLVPNYLHLAIAYRSVGRFEDAEELCHWLSSFYEAAYLEELDTNSDLQDACLNGATAQAPELERSRPRSSSACAQRGGST